MKKTLLSILPLLLIVGCSNVASYAEMEDELGIWYGKHIDELFLMWGAPTSVYETESGEYIIYTYYLQIYQLLLLLLNLNQF